MRDSKLHELWPDCDPDDASFTQPKRPTSSPASPRERGQEVVNWVLIAIGVLAVELAVIHPGYDVGIILLGGALAGWGSYGLLTRP